MGLLSRAYGAVDPFLPGDGLLDPMFGGGAQPAPQGRPQAHRGGLLGGLGTAAHVVDNVLGLGIGDAVHKERQASRNADLAQQAQVILGDQTLDKPTRIQKMRAVVADAAAKGADVTDWVNGLDAAESQMNLLGLFSPKPGADGSTPAGVPGVSAAAPVLARELFRNPAATKGIEAILKDAQPDIAFDNGIGYNKTDPSNVGAFHPTLDKGEEPVFNARGEVVGIRNADGSIKAKADVAGAVAGAQEGGKAAFDIVQVPMPDGSTRSMTRLQAAQLFGGQGGAPNGDIGRSQTPADQVTARGNAQTQVDRGAAQPQQFSGLQDQARTSALVLDNIDKALGMINRLTSGALGGTSAIPGTPARDLKAVLDTIRANVGFAQLQKMRENSPTGGALGQVSERENELLQSVLGSLDQNQSPEQLKANLAQAAEQLRAIAAQRQQLYDQTYSQPAGPTTTGKGYKIISVQ